jgi:hypothetical protein
VKSACNPSYCRDGDRTIEVRGQPRQKVGKTHLKNKLDMVLHTVISATWEAKVRGPSSKAGPCQKHETLSVKQTKSKRIGGVTQ